MTFSVGSIQGFPQQKHKRIKKTVAWACKCGPQPRYMNNCLECGTRRP